MAHPYGYGQVGNSGPEQGMDQEVLGWFQALDADGTGELSASELQAALTNSDWSPFDEETCTMMIGMFDISNTGKVNLQEFGALWQYVKQWRIIYEQFDQNRSGTINHDELQIALQQMGYQLSPEFASAVIKAYDPINKESLTLDKFIQACVKLKSTTDSFRQRDDQMMGSIEVSYEDFLTMIVLER